jgi:glycosyltransferase involved in cell wall biosynthesis
VTEVDRRWGHEAVPGDDVMAEPLAVPARRARGSSRLVAVDSEPGGAELATARLERTAARALYLGLERVQMLAWRDFEDPEAGGSELHAHNVASAWARVGIDVSMRTSAVPGHPSVSTRSGYRVIRKSGRYGVFPRSALSGMVGRRGHPDGLVEIWNGMPFFSPVWARCPRVVFLHHVHAAMWKMVLSPRLATLGQTVELRLAPPFYRHSRVVTLSPSSRDEIVSMLGIDAGRVSVVPPGLDSRFAPGGKKSPVPLVVAVGRLVPVKRLELLLDALARVRQRVPGLRAVLVGEGYERPHLEAKIKALGATSWVELTGRVSDDELVDTYRRAWVLASTSLREGWNMTITEAGACGTPAVVSDIAGHRDSLAHGVTGLLANPGDELAGALERILTDGALRESLASGAVTRARSLTWDATAAATLSALVDEAETRRVRS